MDNALGWDPNEPQWPIHRKLVEMPVVRMEIVEYGNGELMQDVSTTRVDSIVKKPIHWILKSLLEKERYTVDENTRPMPTRETLPIWQE